jgi:glyoxylase-like metal-dependent hydrolase (beta-lactamase superfamily II)
MYHVVLHFGDQVVTFPILSAHFDPQRAFFCDCILGNELNNPIVLVSNCRSPIDVCFMLLLCYDVIHFFKKHIGLTRMPQAGAEAEIRRNGCMLMQQLTERIFFMKNQEETDRPVLGYVRGDCGSLMVDAGNSPAHVARFRAGLNERGLADPDWVSITHWHWDHCYGLCAFAASHDQSRDHAADQVMDHAAAASGEAAGGMASGDRVALVNGRPRTFSVACRLTNEALFRMSRWTWDDDAMKRRIETGEDIAFCDEHIRKEYPDRSKILVRTADVIFDDRLTIDLGGISCNLIRVGGSHADDSVVIHVPEERVVFVGDAISPDLHHGPAKYDRVQLATLIDRLEQLDFDTCVPSHDDPWSRDEVFAYLREELAAL